MDFEATSSPISNSNGTVNAQMRTVHVSTGFLAYMQSFIGVEFVFHSLNVDSSCDREKRSLEEKRWMLQLEDSVLREGGSWFNVARGM